MFQIGEFSKIAQTSVSQLRYYDEIGLFRPMKVDEVSGYRYYSATQLPELNRIVALKELGLPLNQIQRMVHDPIGADEIRGMLRLRKSQIEQTVRDEIARLHMVEARLRQIEQEGILQEDEVVIKTIPAYPFLSLRKVVPHIFDIRMIARELRTRLPMRLGAKNLGNFTVILHGNAFSEENADIELGYLLNNQVESPLRLPSGDKISTTILPRAELAATTVRLGPFENGYESYAKLGRWVEENQYKFAGPAREEFLVLPTKSAAEAVVEIQMPIVKISNAALAIHDPEVGK